MSNPNESTPFEKIFEDMADLLQFAVDNMDKPLKKELPKDLDARLDQLEKEVAIFCRLNQAIIAQTPEGERSKGTAHLTRKERKTIERCERLKEEATRKMALLPEDIPTPKPLNESERRKRYKRINRKQDWKHL